MPVQNIFPLAKPFHPLQPQLVRRSPAAASPRGAYCQSAQLATECMSSGQLGAHHPASPWSHGLMVNRSEIVLLSSRAAVEMTTTGRADVFHPTGAISSSWEMTVLRPGCICTGLAHTPQSASGPGRLLDSPRRRRGGGSALQKPQPGAQWDSFGSWGFVQPAVSSRPDRCSHEPAGIARWHAE